MLRQKVRIACSIADGLLISVSFATRSLYLAAAVLFKEIHFVKNGGEENGFDPDARKLFPAWASRDIVVLPCLNTKTVSEKQ